MKNAAAKQQPDRIGAAAEKILAWVYMDQRAADFPATASQLAARICPDAAAIHAWCRVHGPLLIKYGRIGSSPDWLAEGPCYIARKPRFGRQVLFKVKIGVLQRRRWPREMVDAARGEYREWHAQLTRFAEAFCSDNDVLQICYVTSVASPAEPWITRARQK